MVCISLDILSELVSVSGTIKKITRAIQGGVNCRTIISLPYPITDSCKVGNQLYCFLVHLLLCLCFKKLNRYIYASLFSLLSYTKGHILNSSVLCFYLENYLGKHFVSKHRHFPHFFLSWTVLNCVCVYQTNLTWTFNSFQCFTIKNMTNFCLMTND